MSELREDFGADAIPVTSRMAKSPATTKHLHATMAAYCADCIHDAQGTIEED